MKILDDLNMFVYTKIRQPCEELCSPSLPDEFEGQEMTDVDPTPLLCNGILNITFWIYESINDSVREVIV